MSTRRKYDTTLRAERAAETRLRIQEAARNLLAKNGFANTTIAAIAHDADVSPQTIYASFGSKAAIVTSMLSYLEGQAGESEVVEALLGESDPRVQLRIFAAWLRKLFGLSSDVFSIVLNSPNQPELAEIRLTGDDRRLGGCLMLAEKWVDAYALRLDLTKESAAEGLWLLSSVETYMNCTSRLGWSDDQYENWLYDSAERLLFR